MSGDVTENDSAESGAPEEVEYHGGLHLRGSVLWFDAEEPRELCFISSATVPEARRHAKIVTTSQTAELLDALGAVHGRGRRAHVPQTLVTPYGRTFALGPLTLELFPSGFVLGAASLLVERNGRRLLYAGYLNTRRYPLAERLEARRCDVLVLPCPPGLPQRLALPPEEEVEAALVSFVEDSLDERRVPVLFCPTLSIAPRVAHLLAARGIALRLHRTILATLRIYGRAGLLDLSRMRRYRGALDVARRPEALLWPLALRQSTAITRMTRARLAFVCERAQDPNYREELACDGAFALSAYADHASLLDYVRACQPRQVVLVGCHGGALGPDLEQLGIDVRYLGPRKQLELFEG